MNTAEHGLEHAFLNLPTLKHVGMALLQFADKIRGTTCVQKTAEGVFRLGFVAFSFPEGSERIRMHVNVDMKELEEQENLHLKWLPLHPEQGSQVCEITHAGQLACAAGYIENAYEKFLSTRQTTSFDPTTN